MQELRNCQFGKEMTLKTFRNMRLDETSYLFYGCVQSKHEVRIHFELSLIEKAKKF